MVTRKNKPPFHNLYTLLSTAESRIYLSIFTGISVTKINAWLDPNSRVVPKADELVLMSKYFGCSIDWLLDLNDRNDSIKIEQDISILLYKLHLSHFLYIFQ